MQCLSKIQSMQLPLSFLHSTLSGQYSEGFSFAQDSRPVLTERDSSSVSFAPSVTESNIPSEFPEVKSERKWKGKKMILFQFGDHQGLLCATIFEENIENFCRIRRNYWSVGNVFPRLITLLTSTDPDLCRGNRLFCEMVQWWTELSLAMKQSNPQFELRAGFKPKRWSSLRTVVSVWPRWTMVCHLRHQFLLSTFNHQFQNSAETDISKVYIYYLILQTRSGWSAGTNCHQQLVDWTRAQPEHSLGIDVYM